jgi:hypothetical protein
MKPDEEIEDLLRRLRPASPSAALRARILSPGRQRRWPWAAAAALLLMTLSLQYASARLRGALPRNDIVMLMDVEADAVASLRNFLDVSEDEARAIVLVRGIQARIAERQEQDPQ